MECCVDGCPTCPTERLTRPGCLSGGGDRDWTLSYRCEACGRFWTKAWPTDLAIAWATEYQRSVSDARTDQIIRSIAKCMTAAPADLPPLRLYIDQRLRDWIDGNGHA